jgi:DNA-binding CsgD family transcriptional regulator
MAGLFSLLVKTKDEGRMTNSNGKLTQREIEILQLAANGLCSNEIGLRMGIAGNTVKNRLNTIYRKLEVSTRLEAVLEATRRGLVVVPGIALASDRRRMRRLERSLELIVSYEATPIVSRRDLIELARKALETEEGR